jgi:site-specific DNA-methyltransferase (cytosine-N4-specific)
MMPLYITERGNLFLGDSFELLNEDYFKNFRNKINLIFTSPPFPLIEKKAYGNLNGQEYLQWLSKFAPLFRDLLAPDGSLVIEIGNAWDHKSPTMSLLPFESLLSIKRGGNFYLCQEFIWNNTSKLPTPAQWVNIERIRVKDSFTRFWWLSPNPRPKANNRHILIEYSPSMKKLLRNRKYNSGKRPSEHNINKKAFLTDNKGAIPSNVISIPNSDSIDGYLDYCKKNHIKTHPARMPLKLAEFFIKFLTNENDLVLDPFAGSNVTGFVAEKNNRNWISIEKDNDYALSSKSRFNFCLLPEVRKSDIQDG